jgi:hypothetical protein
LGIEENHNIEHKKEKERLKKEHVKIMTDYEYRAERKKKKKIK